MKSCNVLRAAVMRGFSALMITAIVCQFGPANGNPGDIFAVAAPVIGSDPPKASDVKDGDTTVSTQTGALQYSYPIAVPPGRQGMAPALSLGYSSQAPLHGGSLGAGWSLSIPRIEEDTSQGRLRTHSPSIEASQTLSIRKADDRFTSSMSGGRALVPVNTDPLVSGVYKNYRAQSDASFARYQRMDPGQSFRWRVYMTDGSIMYFGDTGKTPGCPITDGNAPLTRHVDSFGNEVAYEYAMSRGECMLTRIAWGQNANAGLAELAEVVVKFSAPTLCDGVYVGAQLSYRSGVAITTGSNKITSLEISALDASAPNGKAHKREVFVSYSAQDESCTGPSGSPKTHAPIRILTSIQESASGVDSPLVTLPAVTFAYGSSSIELDTMVDRQTPWFDLIDRPAENLGWGYRRDDDRWPTVEAMMLDVDGDGLVDRVHNATATTQGVTSCKATWQRNNPAHNSVTGHFENPRLLTFGDSGSTRMPMLRWQGADPDDPGSEQAYAAEPWLEGCALNGQVTAFHNSHSSPGVCHDDATACVPGSYCPDGNVCPGLTQPGPRTYLAYRWIDMDGDHLADLVAAVHGDAGRYDIIRGNDRVGGVQVGFEPPLFGTVPIPGGFPSCTGLPERCKRLGSDCMNRIDNTNVCDGSSVCSYDWADINACVSQAPDEECMMEIALLKAGNDPGDISDEPGSMASPRFPYRMCNNLYPWFIFKNRGNGNFADTPVIKYQPVPLESDNGDSSLTGPGIAATNHGVLDIDGDGLVDGVVRARDGDQFGHAWWWYVWLNDGTGGLGPTRHVWGSRHFPRNAINGVGTTQIAPDGTAITGNSMGLFDINGDGLVDHWHENQLINPPLQTANVAYNDGTGFRLLGPVPPNDGELTTNTTKPASEAQNYLLVTESAFGKTVIKTGAKYARLRPFDVDGDGRQDLLIKNSLAEYPSVAFNLGGQFKASGLWSYVEYGASQDAAAIEINTDRVWQVITDLTDLNDDGIPESTYWANHVMKQDSYNLTANGAPRLLRTVSNGRGAVTTIDYSSTHDKNQTDPVVEQNPDELWAPGRPKASPRNQWVVKSISVNDVFANTTSATSYRYKNPRFNADDDGRFGFRGFEEVRTTAPSGMTTVQRFSFDPDWSGRLAATLVIPAEDASKVRSIDKTTWTALTLTGTPITTYHATLTEHFTCANTQNEATCTASAAPAYARTETVLQELPLSGPKMLWQDTLSVLKKQVADADGDRDSVTTFDLISDATTYRLRPRNTMRRHRVGGAMTLFARSEQTWDPTLRAKLTDEVWFDTNDANRAVTKSVYDMTTGNVLEHWKPVQNAAATTKTTYTFDARKLFAIAEVNEKGHPFDYTFEYGTGTKLTTTGPNQRTCTTQPTCLNGPSYPIRETKKIRVDGLGRMIERWETTSDDGAFYTLRQFEKATYTEGNGSTVPQSVLSETALNLDATQWKQEKAELDGHGRPTRKTLFAQGSAPSDHVTTYSYRNDGTLQSISLPDPTANNASVVTYTYGFDSLGRATSIRRPDAVSAADRSGADVTYDGVTKTVTEVVGAANGLPATTKTISDPFGRLIQVHERTTPGSFAWAITNYSYGPDDLVTTVVDPQSVTTNLTHDLAGHRTQITRHGRVWKYGYDKNGNMISEQVPGSPTPPVTDPDYTTTTAYDDLDRPVSRVIGSRGLSAADRDLFASGTETLTWDLGSNHVGFVRYFSAYAPNASTPAVRQELFNDNQGRRTITQHHLTIAGYPATSRQFRQTYRPFGGVATTFYGDAVVPGGADTSSTIGYDLRGYPSTVQLVRGGVPTDGNIQIAALTRNVAGLVTKRRANTTGPMTFIESNWTYDKLGRVTDQLVQKGPGPTQVVRQSLTYFGNDDPSTLAHSLGTNTKQFAFGYDFRHQLTSANETTSPGYFTSSYGYGTAGRLTNATLLQTVPAPGSELKSRAVDYQYADADPERVTALINGPSAGTLAGLPYATYTYDQAGNQRTRCYGAVTTPSCLGESVDFVYDGNDQLRRATKKNNGTVVGSEEYWYGTNDQRIAIVRHDAAGLKTEAVWFVGDAEPHFDGGGSVTRVYSHVSVGTPVSRVDRTTNTIAPVEFQFHGLASSNVSTVDYNGTINSGFSYAPFGEVLESAEGGGTGTQRRRFNDKYQDDLTDLRYYGVRYMDNVALEWIASDPLFRVAPERSWDAPRRANLYTFSLNNPLRYLDPDGREGDAMLDIATNSLSSTDDYIAVHKGVGFVLSEIGAEVRRGFYTRLCDSANCYGGPPTSPMIHAVVRGFTGQEQTPLQQLEDSMNALGGPRGGGGATGGGDPVLIGPNVNLGKNVKMGKDRGTVRSGADFTGKQKKEIRDNNRKANNGKLTCEKCGRNDLADPKVNKGGEPKPANEAQVDHVVPKSKGGANSIDNSSVLCIGCNNKKSNK